MPESQFSKVFEPLMIGQIPLKNRVILPAIATCFATQDCFVTDQMIRYYARRAEGGVGFIIIEATCIDNPAGRANPHQLCIDDDKYLPGLSKLAAAVHSGGAKVALQLHHARPRDPARNRRPVAGSVGRSPEAQAN